jgi:hypothetical protein
MTPDAEIAHSSRTRLRIRIPSRRGDVAYFMTIAERFSACEGIENIEVNPRTASLLFIHKTDVPSIAEYAASHGIFHAAVTSSTREYPSMYDGVTASFNAIDGKIKRFTKNELDLSSMTFLALVGAGIYKIAKGDFGAPALYTAYWYGLNLFLKSKPEGNGTE